MTEREIRDTLAGVCEEVDHRRRSAISRGVRGLLLPSLLGAGLLVAATACYGAPYLPEREPDRTVHSDKELLDTNATDTKAELGQQTD